ncbi:redoxin domain-containing protein [bacterium]|nr:redoxin domain-containing protein [bacterium]
MQRVILTTAVAGLLLLVALFSACSINESDVEELGALKVSAMDTTQGITLQRGQVLVDNVPSSTRLPVEVGSLPSGQYEVTIKPGLLYPPATKTVNVDPPETTFVDFLFSADTPPSTLTLESNTPDAMIVIDEQFQPTIEIGVPFLIAAGDHSVSLFKEGHLTNSSRLDLTLLEDEEYTYTIDLTAAEYGNQTGDLFPDFTLPDDWGGEQTLGQYRGDVILVTFWFYNCTPCREEFPTIETVFQERAADGFRVLGINVGWYNDDQAKFEAIRDELNLSFPLLFNTYGISWTTDDLLIGTAPTNFIIAPSGKIHSRRGQITYESLNDLIDEALGN